MYEQFEKLLISACKVIFGECDGNLRRHWHPSSSSYHMKSLLLWLVGEGIDLLNVVHKDLFVTDRLSAYRE